MSTGIVGRDVYLRIGNGPVQQFRAWDAPRFVKTQVERGLAEKDGAGNPTPVIVTAATRAQYLAERKK